MAALVALALGGESNMWSWLNRVPSRWALSCIVAEVRWAFGPTLFPPLASFPTEEPLDLLLQLPPSCLPSVVIPTRIQSLLSSLLLTILLRLILQTSDLSIHNVHG
ncbi:uncharacterized protein BO96DRAFT_266552 [Aspergillus niger CBS 101883]|uniref:uncharacterized protein n=1 Tax=Aspergillus lacticoffeatus (strain CBS 101883) TaxID=1450533 RepID=UPI000D7FB738|nr:uncharacterized protein BO96DRAFT_266552 [Aspergillus niger CBS 101883]PYH57885.1 hypothetical protein BO96DRAFT_266552 [Aspergillus niger CBS 101883]